MRAKSSNEKQKKITFNKNKIFYASFLILAFALFFLLGTWSEKYDYSKKVKIFINDISETVSNRLFSNFYEVDKLIIDMNYRNYQKF